MQRLTWSLLSEGDDARWAGGTTGVTTRRTVKGAVDEVVTN
jgi:hypothetical protein